MKKHSTILSSLMVVLVLILTGCRGLPADSKPASVSASGKSGWNRNWNEKESKYTKADYELALSFRKEKYENQSVEQFNRQVMDWENEEAYHATEEAFERLSASLPEEDENANFIFRTLFTSWRECEKKHYNACAHSRAPWHSGWINWEVTGDIFGDRVVLAGGYSDFSFNYSIPEEDKLTVGERDALLQGVETSMEKFLASQGKEKLAKEETMEKALEKELKRQLESLGGGIRWEGELSLNYWWNQSWENAGTTAIQEGGSIAVKEEWSTSGAYTPEQYQLAVRNLKFDGYESMPVAEFNRKIHTALTEAAEGAEKNLEELLTAYEMLLSSLPESDPNYSFFHETIRNSQNEYEAKSCEVYTGRITDPEVSDSCYEEVKEDVYGDQVTVGAAEVEYCFTYRILKENELTVAERDSFLQTVRQKMRDQLNVVLSGGGESFDRDKLQKDFEAVGKTAGSEKIQFTGCTVQSCEVYR